MSIGQLFLKTLASGFITQDELTWIARNQLNFSKCEHGTALKLGKLVDSGQLEIQFSL